MKAPNIKHVCLQQGARGESHKIVSEGESLSKAILSSTMVRADPAPLEVLLLTFVGVGSSP